MYGYFCVNDIRGAFLKLYADKKFTSVNREGSMTSLVGSRTIEIVNASFIADQDAIFGTVNEDYVRRETQWYNSMSLNVNDIPGGPPAIWKAVADRDGFINSNYGWCVYSGENLSGNSGPGYEGQFDKVVQELRMNPESRRAVIIYTRPSMWLDYNKHGRSDFMCLRGDVKVNSPEGDLPIKDVVEKIKTHGKWPVYSVNYTTGEREITWATRGEKTGRKKLIRVHLDDGSHLDVTPEHKFFVKSKKGGKWNYNIEVPASDLTPGTQLIDLMLYKNGNGLCFKRTLAGEFSFDKRVIVHRKYYELCTGQNIDDMHVHHANEDPTDNRFCNLVAMEPSAHLRHHTLGDKNPIHTVADRTNQLAKMVISYKQRVAQRDISWYEQRNGVTLKESLETAEKWFADPTRASLRKFKQHLKATKKTGMLQVLTRASRLSGVPILKMVYQNTKVLIVEQLDIEDDVYDIEVPGNHNFFVGNGVLVHNCTNAVQYLVRDGRVHAVVQMRSNDAVLGYKNDRHWQQHVLNKVAAELSVPVGNIYWTVGSLHVYERHFYLLDQTHSNGQS